MLCLLALIFRPVPKPKKKKPKVCKVEEPPRIVRKLSDGNLNTKPVLPKLNPVRKFSEALPLPSVPATYAVVVELENILTFHSLFTSKTIL